jgi:hypothetical protein
MQIKDAARQHQTPDHQHTHSANPSRNTASIQAQANRSRRNDKNNSKLSLLSLSTRPRANPLPAQRNVADAGARLAAQRAPGRHQQLSARLGRRGE